MTCPRSQSHSVEEQRFKPEPGELQNLTPVHYKWEVSSLGKPVGAVPVGASAELWTRAVGLQGPLEAT